MSWLLVLPTTPDARDLVCFATNNIHIATRFGRVFPRTLTELYAALEMPLPRALVRHALRLSQGVAKLQRCI
jgi:hypothetical protein